MRLTSRVVTIGLVAVGVFIGAGVTGVYARRKIHQVDRYCTDVPCMHYDARMSGIRSVIGQRGTGPVYLAIGDSITEWADLPRICGRKPLNAGIGWATTTTFVDLARELADHAGPDFIIVALGTNDALDHKEDGFEARMKHILASLAPWPVIVVPVPPSPRVLGGYQRLNAEIAWLDVNQAEPLEKVDTLPDGIHLAPSGYVDWKKALLDEASRSVCSGAQAKLDRPGAQQD